MKSKSYLLRVSLTIAFVGALFLAGFKFGLFLFLQQKETKNVSQNLISQISTSTNPTNKDVKNKIESREIKKITESRGIEINLTDNKALLYDEGKLIKSLSLAYQSPEDKWFQAPTGYFRAGVKKEKHLSSIFPVYMPYSIQYYEDFFIHGIPYYKNGESVSSQFTGGCLRFESKAAKEIYDFLKTGDQILVYKTFNDLKIKAEFHQPVDLKDFFIERRFLNPYRQFWLFSGTDALKDDYYQHTGVDLRPMIDDLQPVYSIDNGKIAKIQLNDGNDHGLGNTIIVEHQNFYSLYAHLDSIKKGLKEGDIIKKGEIIGKTGNSGFGCRNYWRLGKDGCDSQAPKDVHLHFEIKKAPVLENPEGGKICEDKINGPKRFCYGYTPDYPQKYGYLNPIEVLFDKINNY